MDGGDWCEQKFAKRAVVGMMDADEDDMEAFATVSNGKWGGSTMVRGTKILISH